jgi:hypothetical protein
MMQSVTRYKYTVFPGELAQLGLGVAEGSHLLPGETPDLGHEDFSCWHASGVIRPSSHAVKDQ